MINNSTKLYLTLLLSLLFFSALPSAVRIPTLVDILPSFTYLLFGALRELNIIALFLISIYRFGVFLRRRQTIFNTFLIVLSIYLFSICLLAFLYSAYGPLVSLTGLRLFALASIPINIILTEPDELQVKISSNIYIILFYMGFCFISLLMNFNSYPAIYGVTFLGPRFPFLYEGPIPACLAFGSFSCFILFCHYIYPKKANILLFLHAVLLFFNMLTGGRSGLIISTLCLAASFILQLSPRIFNTIFSPKVLINRIFTVLLAPALVISLFLLSSNPLISGRKSTAYQIERSGLIGGSFESRISIFQRAASNTDNFVFVFGSPGLGTNVSTQFKLIPEKFMNSDSFISSSFLSFGFVGLILVTTLAFIFWNYSFSSVILFAVITFSATTSLPENVLPWTQLCLVLAYSRSLRAIKQ